MDFEKEISLLKESVGKTEQAIAELTAKFNLIQDSIKNKTTAKEEKENVKAPVLTENNERFSCKDLWGDIPARLRYSRLAVLTSIKEKTNQ